MRTAKNYINIIIIYYIRKKKKLNWKFLFLENFVKYRFIHFGEDGSILLPTINTEFAFNRGNRPREIISFQLKYYKLLF